MQVLQKDKESVPDKTRYVIMAILGVILMVASIYALFRALNKYTGAAGKVLAAPGATDPMLTNLITPEEIERQHAAYQPPAPAIPAVVAAPSPVMPANHEDAAVILHKEKTKFNQQIVERLKQYVKDNPTRDNRELERQIKKRENQDTPVQ